MKLSIPILSFVLISAIMLQVLGKSFIYADYIINKKAITQKYCVNKSKPKLHCNGKCHMMMKMKEEDKKENTPTNNIKEKYEIQLFTCFKASLELPNTITTIKHHSFYVISKSASHLLSVFHPPTC